jgi:hypothetical protein
MKAILGFLISIVVITLLICIAGWMFITDFLIFDIILILALIILKIAFWVFIIIGVLWILNEIFR